MTSDSIHDEERSRYESFASNHAEEEYRQRMAILYTCWHRFNQEYFGGRLREPHLGFGRTAPRSLGHCAEKTQYGGQIQITLNERLVFGTNLAWVVNPWPPAVGTRLFIEDLLLRFTVRQFVLEVHEAQEATHDGFGTLFATEASRISGVEGRSSPATATARISTWPVSGHIMSGWKKILAVTVMT